MLRPKIAAAAACAVFAVGTRAVAQEERVEPQAIAPPPAPARSPAPEAPAAPFAFGDFTWANGQSRQKDFPLKAFDDAVTLSLYLDVNYAYSLNHPRDDTLTGTASVPRHNEFDVNLASVGLEWSYKNVIGRLSLQYGSMISIVQDLDGTTARGRNAAIQNLRYVREATAGYHFDALHGVNVEGGIFMSYI
ncbi:MAG TPA: outer membrane beta-barrel protein, partial [Labilithrix sp.]